MVSVLAANMLEILKDIKDPDGKSKNDTLQSRGIITPQMISSDSKYSLNDTIAGQDEARIAFGMPITLSISYKPFNPSSINGHLIGLAIIAKLNLILPKGKFKLDV